MKSKPAVSSPCNDDVISPETPWLPRGVTHRQLYIFVAILVAVTILVGAVLTVVIANIGELQTRLDKVNDRIQMYSERLNIDVHN